MAINLDWKLIKAISDDCKHYNPNTNQPTWVTSESKWMIYECMNFAPNKNWLWQCLGCKLLPTNTIETPVEI